MCKCAIYLYLYDKLYNLETSPDAHQQMKVWAKANMFVTKYSWTQPADLVVFNGLSRPVTKMQPFLRMITTGSLSSNLTVAFLMNGKALWPAIFSMESCPKNWHFTSFYNILKLRKIFIQFLFAYSWGWKRSTKNDPKMRRCLPAIFLTGLFGHLWLGPGFRWVSWPNSSQIGWFLPFSFVCNGFQKERMARCCKMPMSLLLVVLFF